MIYGGIVIERNNIDINLVLEDYGNAISERMDDMLFNHIIESKKEPIISRIKWKIKNVYYDIGMKLLYIFFRGYYDDLNNYYNNDW